MNQHIKLLGNSFITAVFFLFAAGFTLQGQLRINEILSVNVSAVHDPDFGRFSDYVEIYNPTGQPINLAGHSISDDASSQRKWIFTEFILLPDHYLVLWADGENKMIGDTAWCSFRKIVITTRTFHLNFRLSGDGEYLGLFGPDGAALDELIFGKQLSDVAYGIDEAVPAKCLYFGDGSPGKANPVQGSTLPVVAGEPVFSLQGGFYQGMQLLNLNSPQQGAIIRYTFDGSEPDNAATEFSAPVEIFRTLTIKARVYMPDRLPGPVITHTYFIDQNIGLPVVSLSSQNENLWGHDFGLFKNAIKEREVPAVLEYFDADGNRGFVMGAGLRLFGSTIYNLPQKPVSIRFRPKYGEALLDYPIFLEKENQRYISLMLRNGGNDYNLAFMRDALATLMVAGKMNIDYQAYKPCVVFINGEYHGIYDIRERIDANFIGYNHELNPETLDILEDSLQVLAGAANGYADLLGFISHNDLIKPENYQAVVSQIDVDAYMNYMIHKIFIGYSLFNLNNTCWREQSDAGRWRWIARDMEHAFGQLGGDNYWENTLAKVSGAEGELPPWAVFLFKNMLRSAEFRDLFIQRFALYLNTLYSPGVTIALVDSLRGMLAGQMPRHIARWGTPASIPVWNGNILFIKEFLNHRPAHIRQHIATQFGLVDSARITIKAIGEGNVFLNGVLINDSLWSGYFFEGSVITFEASPKAGKRFVGWQGGSRDDVLSMTPSGDTIVTALFEPVTTGIVPADISTDTVLTLDLSPWYVPEDVTVHPGATLTVQPGIELRLADKASVYIKGNLKITGSINDSITIKPAPERSYRKPWYNPRPRWGVISLQGAEDTITISYTNLSGSSYGKNRDNEFATVTSFNSLVKLSHVTISNTLQPFYSEYGWVYIGHSRLRCELTGDLINVKYADDALVEHCDLRGNRSPDSDAIDFDGVKRGTIRLNRIYAFHAPNSDGIDLGEGAKNVTIGHNIIYDCNDKGISVGQGSQATVIRNLIFNCNMGVAVKDSFSYALIDQNTFSSSNYAVAVYEKNAGKGGGVAEVKNSILSNSFISPVWADGLSQLETRYSISDYLLIPGVGNLAGLPGFIDPGRGNFGLLPTSPCINTGDPATEPDPDLSRADMGAYYTHTQQSPQSMRLNEINYRSPFNYQAGDWIEVFNEGQTPVNLKGWHIKDPNNSWFIRDNLIIPQGAYHVLCEDTIRFKSIYPALTNATGGFGFDLSNRSGQVRILDAGNNPVNAVNYADRNPWPSLADGKGASLELIEGRTGNIPEDWQASYTLMGTPGIRNSLPPDITGVFINELMAANENTIADEYGEFDDWFELYNSNDFPVNLAGLCFTDNAGEPCRWQLPLNYPEITSIGPHGYLLVWADGQPDQGILHADFSLSSIGEVLAIFQKIPDNFRIIDHLTFDPQIKTQSYGRFPDGGQQYLRMPTTPGKSNILTSLPVNKWAEVIVFPNPYGEEVHFVLENLAKPYIFEISDISGKTSLIYRNGFMEKLTIAKPALPSGICFYRIVAADGAVYTGKLVSAN